MSRWDEDCAACEEKDCEIGALQEEIYDRDRKIEELEAEIEVLLATDGKGYEYGPSTATTITSMEHLKTWVANHNKHYRK